MKIFILVMFWKKLKPLKTEYYPAAILKILTTRFALNVKYEKMLFKKIPNVTICQMSVAIKLFVIIHQTLRTFIYDFGFKSEENIIFNAKNNNFLTSSIIIK